MTEEEWVAKCHKENICQLCLRRFSGNPELVTHIYAAHGKPLTIEMFTAARDG